MRKATICWSSSDCSSSVWSPASRGISSRRAVPAVWRRATKPATTSPRRTAVTRSTRTVATAVTASTAASPRVERARARRLDTRTMCTAVATSTPARAARGISETQRAASSTTSSRKAAWVSAAHREVAPERTLTAVRAMAAVAGIPPNSGAARLASPWPTSSRSESWRWPDAHGVRHRRRQQALQGGQGRHGHGRQEEGVEVAERDVGQGRARDAAGDPADGGGPEVQRRCWRRWRRPRRATIRAVRVASGTGRGSRRPPRRPWRRGSRPGRSPTPARPATPARAPSRRGPPSRGRPGAAGAR